jgi:hypothetical protein
MRNPDVLAITGFSRGVACIAWNILNSHPAVCAALIEENQIVEQNRVLRALIRFSTSMSGKRGRNP